MRLGVLLLASVTVLGGLAGCGDDAGAPPAPDGAVTTPELEIPDPPGDSIGLALGDRATLRVRLHDADGAPSAGAEIAFAIAADADAGGSVLSAPTATTDDAGEAIVDLTAGASRATFVVTATAADAAPVAFTIAVAPGGFAAIDAFPRYEGTRPAIVFARRIVRLYPGTRCGAIVPEELPPTPYPMRTIGAWGDRAAFRAVPAGEPASIYAWGETEAGAILAIGCVELAGPQLRAGGTMRLEPAVRDRAARLPEDLLLDSVIDVRAGLAPVVGRRGGPWAILGCPSGVGQAVLDAALAELAPADPRRVAVEAARATPDPVTGCRDGDGTPDGAAHAVIVAGAPGTALVGAPVALDALARALRLGSTLTPAAGGIATHRLRTLGAGTEDEDLVASSRPRVETPGVRLDVEVDGTVRVGQHAVALWPGAILRRALRAQLLVPAGVPPAPSPILPSVLEATTDGVRTGCAAISAAACAAAGTDATCLDTACASAAAMLELELDAPFATFATTDVDLTWQGVGRLVDLDLDGVADGATGGLWSGRLDAGDSSAGVTATFATPVPTAR